MSKEKMYALKNDEGEWLDQDRLWGPGTWATPDKDEREKVAKCYGGHVVTLIEEPEKVVLTKEQAEIVENARDEEYPATYISNHTNACDVEESLLIKAYVNGYTVEKETKYNVKVPNTKDVWYYKSIDGNLRTICPEDKKLRGTFTEAEIEHYGLQDCERVEINTEDSDDN